MSRIMIIGIGGLDADLLRVYCPLLPNLRRLMLESPFLELTSTIPPEPVPAWTSVYTGLNPARHGMLEKTNCLERLPPDSRLLRAELFWERAARAGKRVCVLNPLLARLSNLPPNLTIVPSVPETTSGQALPAGAFPALLDEPLIPPSSQLTSFCQILQERTEQQVQVALEMYARQRWDLFFVQLDALDHVQHFLWRYSDPGDPMYPGKNEHTSRILDFYRLFDRITGRMRAVIPADCMLVIVSSHGHERRCTHRLHINEWLRERRFLVPQSRNNPSPVSAKKPLGNCVSWLHYLCWPGGRDHLSQSIDQEQSVAQLVELAGTTSSYAGIRLNRALIERQNQDYEQVRESILAGLGQLSFKDGLVVNWVRKREDCYQGELLDRYPDLLFELRSDFGVGRGIYAPLIVPDSTHRLISGTHSAHGVLLMENWPEEVEFYTDFPGPSVMDVAPTLLHLLDIECASLDGQVLVHPRTVSQLI